MDVRGGAILGRYELLTPIAEGGMARVWAARLLGHGSFTKIVALKMILPELAGDRDFQQMFLDEARIAAKVRHPNACETFDLVEHRGMLFLAMEWIDGTSLLRLLRRGSAEESGSITNGRAIEKRLAARIIADACAGLHAAHDLVDDDGTPLGVVHRDISPHNLLISASGIVKVTDFGVAKALGKSHLTSTGQLKGKLAYMSPEQLRSGVVDRRSDVFALGCILYQITVGRQPFPAVNEAQLVSAILLGQVTAPRTLDAAYDPELEAIVMRAMAHEAGDRFPSAEALRFALEHYIARGGQLVGAANIAQLLRERCHEEIERRREQIRAACAQPRFMPEGPVSRTRVWERPAAEKPPQEGPAVQHTNVAVALERPRVDARPGAGLSVVLLTCAAVVVGAAGWYAIARGTVRSSAAASSSTSVAFEPPTPLTTTTTVLTAPSSPTTEARPERVTFRVSPEGARLVVDGVVLPEGAVAIQRPEGERTVQVIVRAERHEDRVEMVSATSPASIDVALTPRARSGPRTNTAATTSSAPARTALPNPYE